MIGGIVNAKRCTSQKVGAETLGGIVNAKRCTSQKVGAETLEL